MSGPAAIDEAALRAWPLPAHPHDADKEARGRVLVIAGSGEMPGAAVLAATAALRAGAGRLTVACTADAARSVAAALPEARVIALQVDADGTLRSLPEALLGELRGADAVLVGPGMRPESAVVALVRRLLPYVQPETALVLDAAAMGAIVARPAGGHRGDGNDHHDRDAASPGCPARTVLTPHAGEMASLLSMDGVSTDKAAVCADSERVALRAAQRWRAVVALKGAITYIAAPDGRQWCHRHSVPGLGTSGSGDVLAGLVAGLAARGASAEQAAAWAVALHARAGRLLAERLGPLGFLARELPAVVPGLMAAWGHAGER